MTISYLSITIRKLKVLPTDFLTFDTGQLNLQDHRHQVDFILFYLV